MRHDVAMRIVRLLNSGEFGDSIKGDLCRTYTPLEFIVIVIAENARFAVRSIDEWSTYYHELMEG